jgi:uracil-DNA glycosylase
VDSSWKERLTDEVKKAYFVELSDFLRKERETYTVFPAKDQVLTAFKATPFDRVKVLILGQDPYHNAGQAHGLSFSVPSGMKPPPSLVNIFKELSEDVGFKKPKDGCLMPWAEQGVFLLNATLTVRAHEPGSHQGKGWETFTDSVIRLLNQRETPIVFVLWGRYARSKRSLISDAHVVLESAHPSPMSASNGFFGSRPFSQVNQALKVQGLSTIDWQLP